MHDENGNMHLAESQKTIEDLAGTIGVSTDAMRSYMTAWA